MNECCQKWAQENARPLNPRDGDFTESHKCPKCGSRLVVTYRRQLGDGGKFEGYALIRVAAAVSEKREARC